MTKARTYLAVLVGVFVTSAILAPGTSANVKGNDDPSQAWHEPIPNIPIPNNVKATCEVTGGVDLKDTHKKGHGLPVILVDPGDPMADPPVPPTIEVGKPVHGFYQFVDVLITCVGNPEKDPEGHYRATFEVDAQGGTDGLAFNPEHDAAKTLEDISNKPKEDPGPKDNPETEEIEGKKQDHGEDLGQGWSHSSWYGTDPDGTPVPGCGGDGQDNDQNVNKGEIAVRNPDTGQRAVPCKDFKGHIGGGTSWVKFVRGWLQDPVTGWNIRDEDGADVAAWGQLDWEDKKTDCFRADLKLAPDLTSLQPKDGNPDEMVLTRATLAGEAVVYNLGDFVDSKTLNSDPDGCDIQKKLTFKKSSPSPGNGGGGNGNGGGGNGGGSRGPNG